MSAPNFGFLAYDNLPSHQTIVVMCQEAGYDRSGIPLHNQPSGPIVAWVKYDPNVDMAGLRGPLAPTQRPACGSLGSTTLF